ncbi:MAG TPA: TonB family protein, partial [Pyrinomonadaceae bacterium]|nr:TonB family protein [Pyrinomonadaceae bacterium]
MKTATLSETKFNARTFVFLITLGLILAIFSAKALAQEGQISLADTLTGLRSKKVSLDERNKLLAEAVRKRGVTFTLSPEIEKELSTTGADKGLLDAIREKAPAPKVAAAPSPKPAATPSGPDYMYFQKRAGTYMIAGEYDLAISDYTKAIEMNSSDYTTFLNRGMAYYNRKSYDQALIDFDVAATMSPKESPVFFARANLYDKVGNTDKAVADFQKVIDLDPANELAKTNLKRLKDDQDAKAAAAAAKQPVTETKPAAPDTKATDTKVADTKTADTSAKTAPKEPESIDLGQIAGSMATRMVTPVYSSIALKAGASGRVSVQVTIDEEGNVTSARAIDGHQFLRQSSEDAARRSKFKPAMYNNHPIKA